jgi:hypothetical protein
MEYESPLPQSQYAMIRKKSSLGLVSIVLTACAGDTPPELSVALEAVVSPAGPGSGEPFLSSSGDDVYMSCLEVSPEGGHDLRFARFDGAGWSGANTIAHSERFFVNWADFPSVTPGPDGSLWAHWLQRGVAGGYDYGVRIVRSSDGGDTWSDPWTPHEDGTATGTLYEDFGDGWEHEILLEGILLREPKTKYPRCTDGERACPPEDCGGPPGYAHMLEALRNPRHPEHAHYKEWIGDAFDPESFQGAY